MTRLSLLVLLVALAIPAAAGAELIRCRTAEGTLVFVEDPSQVPAGCQPVEASGGGTLNIMPSRDYLAPEVRAETVPSQDGAAAQGREDVNQNPSPAGDAVAGPDSWRTDAEELVANYRDALLRRQRESFMTDKQLAMREMADYQGQKARMLGDLVDSGLSRDEQRQIREILDGIPAP